MLNFSNRLLKYAAEGSNSFYILHQTVIVIIGYFVVQWSASIAVKYLVIASALLGGTILAYDLLVKRTNLTRFLFGMKLLPSSRIQIPKEQPQTGD